MSKSAHPDPFADARQATGLGHMNDQGEDVTMVLGHRDVRKCAHNWRTFSSEVEPGRIVVPSEVNIRDTRQVPFEVDPPRHTAYRALVEEWFKRPKQTEYRAALDELVAAALNVAISATEVEVVHDFALPLQSRALTLLLGVPAEEAEVWIGWGTHVFRSEDDPLDGGKADALYDYIDAALDKAEASPGDDLYSLLLAAEVDGRNLTREEIKGVIILTFAGGRDTVINAVTNTIAHFAEHPDQLRRLETEPELIGKAVEELIRYFAPLTHMGRVATEATQVCAHAVKANDRISLCWAAANRDESVFDNPNEIVLDRQMNPHLSFGFGTHNCLGATHAREVLQALIRGLSTRVDRIDWVAARENIEQWGHFERKVGYHQFRVQFHETTN